MNVIGFDDGPFRHDHRGDVLLVGVVCASTRIDGIVTGRVRRDGADATRTMIDLVRRSPFAGHVQAVLLQGIAVGGFNVVDIHTLSEALALPVLVVARRRPDMAAVRRALFSAEPSSGRPRVKGAERKWRLIEDAGPMERLDLGRRAARGSGTKTPSLFVQCAGLSLEEARRVVLSTTLHGNLPEPLRVAHLVAGGVTTGFSRGAA